MVPVDAIRRIAPGHDNVDGMKAFNLLSPPLFKDYRRFQTRWSNFEARETGGDLNLVPVDYPREALIFPALLQLEVKYIFEELLNSQESGPVTYHTQDRRTQTWKNFNGTLEMPALGDVDWSDLEEFYDVEVIVRDLIEIV